MLRVFALDNSILFCTESGWGLLKAYHARDDTGCFFSQFTATPPSPTWLEETFNASVQSLLLAGFAQPTAAECWRGRGGKLSRIRENTLLNEHPIY